MQVNYIHHTNISSYSAPQNLYIFSIEIFHILHKFHGQCMNKSITNIHTISSTITTILLIKDAHLD